MTVQVVKVRFVGTTRLYSYLWRIQPEEGRMPLQVGDRVEVPANWLNPDGSSGTVAELGSDYTGQMAEIVRKIE
jgi:hypothetical protein